MKARAGLPRPSSQQVRGRSLTRLAVAASASTLRGLGNIGVAGSIIFVRLVVEAADEAATAPVARKAEARLGRIVERSIEPYWKEPGWHEVTLRVAPADSDIERAFARVRDALGKPWNEGSAGLTRFAIWNAGEGAQSVDDRVRFINLEVVSGSAS